jgi:hypothetical protein
LVEDVEDFTVLVDMERVTVAAGVDVSRVPEMAQQQRETLATDSPKVHQARAARVSFSPK